MPRRPKAPPPPTVTADGKTGSVWYPKTPAGEPRRWPSGHIRYRGKVTWPDQRRQDVGVPEKHCYSKARAVEYVASVQEGIDINGGAALAAAVARAAPKTPALETCDEWYERFAATRAGKVSTADADVGLWNKWISPTIGKTPIVQLSPDDVEAVRDVLDRAVTAWEASGKVRGVGLAYSSAGNVWQILTHAMKHASTRRGDRAVRAREGLGNPCEGIRPTKSGSPKRRQWLRPAEVSALLACEAVPLEWREAIAIGLYLHLRPGELQELRVKDVDLDAGEVAISRAWDAQKNVVKAPKSDEGVRTVTIPAALSALLARLVKDAMGETLLAPVLAATSESNKRAELFRGMLKRASVERAELFVDTMTHEQVDFRSIRDTGITWRFLAGDRAEVVQREAGHEELSTTLGYAKEVQNRQGRFGEPFPPLPDCLREPSTSTDSPVITVARVGFESIPKYAISGNRAAKRTSSPKSESRGDASNEAKSAKRRDVDGPIDAETPGALDLVLVSTLARAALVLCDAGAADEARPLLQAIYELVESALRPRRP